MSTYAYAHLPWVSYHYYTRSHSYGNTLMPMLSKKCFQKNLGQCMHVIWNSHFNMSGKCIYYTMYNAFLYNICFFTCVSTVSLVHLLWVKQLKSKAEKLITCKQGKATAYTQMNIIIIQLHCTICMWDPFYNLLVSKEAKQNVLYLKRSLQCF